MVLEELVSVEHLDIGVAAYAVLSASELFVEKFGERLTIGHTFQTTFTLISIEIKND